MKIGITGATGQLGRLTIAKLRDKVKPENLTALVRSTGKAADLNIPAREFDYSKPEKLADALKGIDTLLLISGNEIGQRAIQHKNVIEAAKKADINRIVYTSLLHADRSTLNLAGEHLETEEALKKSGIKHTIMRNGWYTENYTGSVKGALASGAFIGSAGNGNISSAPREDFAEAAAVVLTGEGHEGKTYELAGDESYTLAGLAEEISKQSGKNIAYRNMPETEYAKILVGFGLPESFAYAVASWDTSASKNDLFDNSHLLSSLIGRPTTPLSQAVKQALAVE